MNNQLWKEFCDKYNLIYKQKKSGNIYLKCFLHSEKTASLVLREYKTRFRCYGCGATGTLFQILNGNFQFLKESQFYFPKYHNFNEYPIFNPKDLIKIYRWTVSDSEYRWKQMMISYQNHYQRMKDYS